MKYQQLTNLECGWKWKYLIKKHREGEAITHYVERSAAEQAIDELLQFENQPEAIVSWIKAHANLDLERRMKQTIRARRKRHFNAELPVTRKKSIDLDFLVWQRLARLAKNRSLTLSEIIIQLIEDAESKEKYVSNMELLKNELKNILS